MAVDPVRILFGRHSANSSCKWRRTGHWNLKASRRHRRTGRRRLNWHDHSYAPRWWIWIDALDPSRCRVIQSLPPKHLAVLARGRRCCRTVQNPRRIEFIAKQFLANPIAVRLTKVIDAPKPIRPDTKLFWAGSPTATNWKRQPRPACYENGRHRRFWLSPRPLSAWPARRICLFFSEWKII